jgi:cell division protein FtsL
MADKKQIDISNLKRQIDKGKSLNEVSVSLGKSKSTILKVANENGLKFENKSHWANL